MLEYHPYDCNISGAHGLTEKNVEAIELSEYSDTLKFAMITDTQRWYDDTYDAVKAINRRNDISFVIHCGDISDFGATKEFVWQRDILQKLRYPYVCIIVQARAPIVISSVKPISLSLPRAHALSA